jgi:hypothetical protein
VTPHEGGDFSALHAMYVKAGLFAPHMHRNLQPIVEQTRDVWERLHRGAADVVRTLVHGQRAQPDGAVTVMRAWEHAWVAQHFVDVSPQINGATGRLQRAYLDHLLPRPDGRFLVFFIKADNHVMTAYMRRFFRSVGTPEAVSTATVGLWVHDGATAAETRDRGAARVRELQPGEHVVVGRAAERCLGADGAAALSMIDGELDLPDTRQRFARAQLVRERSCRVVEVDGQLCHALLEEHSTPGINLTWMLNATWIVPIHCAADGSEQALGAALEHIIARPAQAPTGERFVNAVGALPAPVMEAAGFRLVADVEMFVLNRAGVHRFFQFASQRYGELEARAQRRRARLESETR